MVEGVRARASDCTTSSVVLASSTSKMSFRTPMANKCLEGEEEDEEEAEGVMRESAGVRQVGEVGGGEEEDTEEAGGRRRTGEPPPVVCHSLVETETHRMRCKAASTPARREATARASASLLPSFPSSFPSSSSSSLVGSSSS
jgi:hypothetical protein